MFQRWLDVVGCERVDGGARRRTAGALVALGKAQSIRSVDTRNFYFFFPFPSAHWSRRKGSCNVSRRLFFLKFHLFCVSLSLILARKKQNVSFSSGDFVLISNPSSSTAIGRWRLCARVVVRVTFLLVRKV